jgi:hypothetical protein
LEPRFKIDLVGFPDARNQTARTPRAPGDIKIGMVGEIISESWARSKSVHPGEIIGIRTLPDLPDDLRHSLKEIHFIPAAVELPARSCRAAGPQL